MKTKKLDKKLVLNKTTITTMPFETMEEAKGGFTAVNCVRSEQSYCYETCDLDLCSYTDYIRCTRMINCPLIP